LVKRVIQFEKLGDRASLLLLFDQMVLDDGTVIPIVASLDTKQGAQAVKVKGQALRNAKIVGHSTLAGKLVGDAVIKGQGAEKGLAIGVPALARRLSSCQTRERSTSQRAPSWW
jgi:hypothetical protein